MEFMHRLHLTINPQISLFLAIPCLHLWTLASPEPTKLLRIPLDTEANNPGMKEMMDKYAQGR